ncbi:hypothetical protein H0H87_008417, partial [Tephrocybe sp. NHM501043]
HYQEAQLFRTTNQTSALLKNHSCLRESKSLEEPSTFTTMGTPTATRMDRKESQVYYTTTTPSFARSSPLLVD